MVLLVAECKPTVDIPALTKGAQSPVMLDDDGL